jgi:hypothetical protein
MCVPSSDKERDWPSQNRTFFSVFRLFDAGLSTFEELEAAVTDPQWLEGPGTAVRLRGEQLHAVR